MTNQETVNEMRLTYLIGAMTHDNFYIWLSEFIGLTYDHIPVTSEAVAKSKDKENLNDISIHRWDSSYEFSKELASAKRIAWSYADNVCCMKALAKKRLLESER